MMPNLLRYPSLYARYMAEIVAEDRQRTERADLLATIRRFHVWRHVQYDLSAPAVRIDLVYADA
jgi:hypothetical protein